MYLAVNLKEAFRRKIWFKTLTDGLSDLINRYLRCIGVSFPQEPFNAFPLQVKCVRRLSTSGGNARMRNNGLDLEKVCSAATTLCYYCYYSLIYPFEKFKNIKLWAPKTPSWSIYLLKIHKLASIFCYSVT